MNQDELTLMLIAIDTQLQKADDDKDDVTVKKLKQLRTKIVNEGVSQ